MSDASTMYIANVSKKKLLKALWLRSKPAAFFAMSGVVPPAFDDAAADKAIWGYIDYFQGRVIKMDLSGPEAKTDLYDRDNGKGAALQALQDAKHME